MTTACPSTGELIQHAREGEDTANQWLIPPLRNAEEEFRHSGWATRRERILEAIAADPNRAKRADRFQNCGACAVIEISRSTHKARVTSWHCHDRLCTPCQHRKARDIRIIVECNTDQRRSRFITLTLRHRDEPLRDMLKRLQKGFAKLRRSKFWKEHVAGAISVPEVKIGADGKWHAHLHIVATGTFIPQRDLSEAWKQATDGDSFICDVRQVQNPRQATHYIAKYVSKPVASSVAHSEAALEEYIAATRGMKAYSVIGDWQGLPETNEADDITDWEPLVTVAQWTRDYDEDQPYAIALAKLLKVAEAWPRNKDPAPCS